MKSITLDDSQEPVIQGFRAVNRSPQASQNASYSVEIQTAPTEPPKKRRKKQKEGDLPSPSKTMKASRKTAARKVVKNADERSTLDKAKAGSKKPTAVAKLKKARPALRETTRSKLNAFRYNALPTPDSETDHAQGNPDIVLPKRSPTRDTFNIGLVDNAKPDVLLSSDLWRNQRPLLNYPWLYSSSDAGRLGEVEPSFHDGEPTESELFTNLLQIEAYHQTATQDSTIVDDEELERLFDDLVDVNAEDSVIQEPAEDTGQQASTMPSAINIPADDKDDDEEDDFPMDEDVLETLYEITSAVNSPSKPSSIAAPTGFSAKEGIDLTDDDTQDVLDLAGFLPGAFLEDKVMPQGKTKSSVNILERTPSTAPTEYILNGSPPKLASPVQDMRSRFVRPPHQPALETPGPIPGLSAEKRILTCFRIGEAINATTIAQRQGHKVFVELYARVLQSIRAGPVQTFRLIDLWSSPDKPGIVLEGRWVGWETETLWEQDGRVFWKDRLGDVEDDHQDRERPYARKCRMIGSLERNPARGWTVTINNLWEAGWDDVAFAKQVFCEPSKELDE